MGSKGLLGHLGGGIQIRYLLGVNSLPISTQGKGGPAGGFGPGRDHPPIQLAKKPVYEAKIKHLRITERETRVNAGGHLQPALIQQMPRADLIGVPNRVTEKDTTASGRSVDKQSSKRAKEADVRIEVKTETGLH